MGPASVINANASEQTPLLLLDSRVKHEAVYRRFSESRKRVILAMIAWCGLMPLFVSGTFIPSIPQIAKDLHSSGQVVSLAISLSIFAACLGGLAGATYSTFYGRRPVYLTGLPLLIIGSIGVACSCSIPPLMICRFVQAFGAAPGMSVGAGVIGDLYKLEERGQAMGIFFAAFLLGPALAPPIGGFAAHYGSWRVMQLSLGICGAAAFLCMYFFFPETSHPGTRGIDKVRSESTGRVPAKFFFMNPLRPLSLLQSPNLLAISLSGSAILLTDYVLMVPLAYTIGKTYNIHNEALIGACFLPCGIGNMIGAPMAGRLSDRVVVRWREQRGGVWYPEDRLRATLSGAIFLVPLSVLFSGLLTQFVPGTVGLVLDLACLFMNGVGVDIVLSPSDAYGVDIMHDHSTEAVAAANGFRSFTTSVAVAGILPLIDKIGVACTNALAALLAWMGCIIILLTIRYGGQMRGWIDMGYSTAETN